MPCSWHLWKGLNEKVCIRLGLRLFGPMVWKLLIIDPTSQRKLNKIENFYRVFKAFLVLLESPLQVRFNRVCFMIFRPMVWKILIFE
jgi:hypothetical protein